MGKGTAGSSTSTTSNQIPPEYQALSSQTGTNISALQNADPISQYLGPNPTQIAPLSPTQSSALGMLNTNLNDARNTPLEESPIAQAGTRYFNNTIAPGVIGQATLSGLGRSTALTNALGAAQANTELPLLQGEQARRDQLINQGFTGGDIERSVTQQGYNAAQQDAIRRQALAEQALFAPLGALPSTTGTQVAGKNSSSGGGLFK